MRPEQKVVVETEKSRFWRLFWKTFKWAATAIGLCGSLLVASSRMEMAYIFILPANTMWMTIAARRKMWSLLVANMLYLLFSILGILHWVYQIDIVGPLLAKFLH